MPSILSAGDVTNGTSISRDTDGALTIQTGAAGAKVNAIALSAAGQATLLQPPVLAATAVVSMVRLNTANGYGSIFSRIRRFTNVDANQGSDITYADSATNGASFTINTAGVYAISYTDNFTGASWVGISRNATLPASNISTLAIAEVVKAVTVSGANFPSEVSCTLFLPAGTVIRPHTDAAPVGTAGANGCMFTITRVA